MKNFKSLALATLTATTAIVTGAEVKAAPAHDQLFNTLQQAGIAIYDGHKAGLEICVPGEDSFTFGAYYPALNAIVLCTNNGTVADMQETLTHEAVHATQDCKVGLHNDRIVPLGDWRTLISTLSAEDKDTIVNLYDKKDWAVETEAFALEDSPVAVNNMVRKFCF